MSIDILKEDIKSKKIRNLYLFYGIEEYLKKYYLESIENILLKEELKLLNRVVLEGKTNLNRIMDNCEVMPAFSERKVVIVKNSGLFKSRAKEGKESGGKSSNEDLITCLQNVPEHTCLVFYETEIDKRLKTVDTVKKSGLVVEFTHQKPAELVRWVVKVFRSFKKDIDAAVASMLVDNSDMGMNEILSEINKVVLYLGDRSIVRESDIEEVCSKSIRSRIFDLIDAIASKKSSLALKVLNDMVILKEPLPKILFMITRQFRHILEMKLLSNEGLSAGEAASNIGITPYAAGKVLKQTHSFSIAELKKAIEECIKMDEAVKTGSINDRIAIELLIAEFAK